MLYETEKRAVYGKIMDMAKAPECPFCGIAVDRPADLAVRRYGEMPVGSCSCGAVYACDASGRNLGSAFIEALVFGCDMDWNLAWSLLPGDDYTEKMVDHYDLESHLIVPGGYHEGRKASGALYFVRLHRDIREVAGEGVQKKLEKARAAAAQPVPPPGPQKELSKTEVENLVGLYETDVIVEAAGRDKRVLRHLKRLLISGDDLTRERAVEILGKASEAAARKDPGPVSNLLRELFDSVSSPGASSWGSMDAIGEIISRSPDLFAGYIPLMYNFLGDRDYRPRVVRALARIGRVRPDLVRGAVFRVLPLLRDPDPQTRGFAAMFFGSLGAREAKDELQALTDDTAAIKIYNSGQIESIAVGSLAREALGKMPAGDKGQETGNRRQKTE